MKYCFNSFEEWRIQTIDCVYHGNCLNGLCIVPSKKRAVQNQSLEGVNANTNSTLIPLIPTVLEPDLSCLVDCAKFNFKYTFQVFLFIEF